MQKLKLKCSIKSGQVVAHKNTQAFLHNNQRTNCSRCVFYEWTIAKFIATWRLLGVTAPSNSAAVTAVATHSMHRKGYQSKLLVVYSKGGRCNFCGFLHYDYRRSSWWSSRDGPQHDRSRSGTFMISMKFNSCASLAMFFIIIPVLFCFFLTQNFIYYTSVNWDGFLLPYIGLQSNWVRKPSKLGLFIFRLCLRCNNVNDGVWHVYKPLFGSSVATCRLVCSEISLSINENKQVRSPRNGRT